MIEFHMEYFDVLFPINLGPLTYKCNDELADIAKPGMIVSAPLKSRTAKGIIVGKSLTVPPVDVKDIRRINSDVPVLSSNMINLLIWMSEYYLTEQGLVLKNMLPKEAFKKVKQRKTKTKQLKYHYPLNIIDINDSMVSGLTDSINKKKYRTFLLHAPSSAYEHSFLIKILTGINNAILLFPEVSLVNNVYPLLSERFGERVCIFHSGLSSGKRSEAIERILSGHSDIVVGTRSAVFAPLKKVSLIAALHEHSGSYKQEGGLCYSGRDVAVKRGYFEGATVLLSSVCPSIGSLYNCSTGKYNLLDPADDIKKPKIMVIDMRHEKLLKPYLSKKVVNASQRYIKNNVIVHPPPNPPPSRGRELIISADKYSPSTGGRGLGGGGANLLLNNNKVMFVINRRGYSTLLQCMDCNYIEECPDCRIPLVLHKTDTGNSHSSQVMKCHYCGYIVSAVPDRCSKCRGYSIKLLGAGTQRIQEDIEDLLGIKTLRLDSDRLQKRLEIEELIGATFRDESRIIIGTKLMTKRFRIDGKFSMAAVLNTDLLLNLPDFRSAEKTFQEISLIIDKIEPCGEVFIQTRMPHHYLFKYLRNYDYSSFFKEELHRRKSLNYPPYSRLLVIKFVSKRDIFVELSEIINKTKKTIPPHSPLVKGGRGDYKIKRIDDKVEILGPISKKNQGKNEFKLLLKSPVRGGLQSVARTLIEAFKDSKDVKVKIDVDPISI